MPHGRGYARYARELPHLFENFGAQMPESPSAERLARLHTLRVIYVQPVAAGGHAYVGLSFDATWELEHGVGVLLHRDRIVEVGGADTAQLMWIAERDAKRRTRSSKKRRKTPVKKRVEKSKTPKAPKATRAKPRPVDRRRR
jgi:hypothetical protein